MPANPYASPTPAEAAENARIVEQNHAMRAEITAMLVRAEAFGLEVSALVTKYKAQHDLIAG